MICPEEDFLTRFVQDPDAVLSALPEFESHLGKCFQCQERIEDIAGQREDPLLNQVFGDTPDRRNWLPQVEGYRILGKVGEGGMASVFRAVQISTGREVAIKFISNISPSFARRVDDERKALLRSDHPHIVNLIDASYSQNGYYFVYPWMDSDLSTWIKAQEVVPIEQAVKIVSQVAAAVQHLHSIGILHRDIKPSNVLLSSIEQTKLTDFGIAKDFSHDNSSSTATLPLGTPGYMAPEQTGLVAGTASIETDVYGLGALLYALLTGRPPFLGGNHMQTVQQVAGEDPIVPRSLRPDVPTDLETICLKCLCKSKEDRYEAAEDFLSDLRRFQRREPIRAKPISRLRKAKHWIRRHPRASAYGLSAIGFSLMVLLLLIWGQRQWLEASRRASILTAVEKLKSCDSFELPNVFEAIDNMDAILLNSVISHVISEGDVQQLRLWLAGQQSEEFSIDRALSGMINCDLRDLPTLQPRIRRLLLESRLDRNGFADILDQITEPEHLLRAAAMFPRQDLDSTLPEVFGDKLAAALETRPMSESLLWSQCLAVYSREISKSLIQQLESRTVEKRAELDSVVSTALHWAAGEPALTLRILERSTVEQLSIASQSPELFSDLLRGLSRQRWEYLRSLQSQHLVNADFHSQSLEAASGHSKRLAQIMLDYDGFANAESGVLLQVPSADLDALLSTLNLEGCSAISFQPYEMDGQPFYTLTFHRLRGENSITEPVPIEELESLVAKRESAGWQPIALWPDGGFENVSVLWKRGGEIDGEVTWPQEGLAEWESSMPEGFTAGMSRCLTAFFSESGSVGLNKYWPSPNSGREVPNFPIEGVSEQGKTVKSAIVFESQHVSRQVRHSQRKVSQLTIHPCSREAFLRKAKAWMGMGLIPQDLFFDPATMKFAGFWELDHTAIERTKRSCAMVALVSWLCGDSYPMLEEFKANPFPSARTLAINAIADIDRRPQRWLALYDDSLDVDQLYSWLIAGSNFRWENGDRTLVEQAEKQIQHLASHRDSAVALAARWMLDQHFYRPVPPPSTTKTPPREHRAWYYSPSGIPFVVIDTDDVHLVTDDSKIPWNRDIHSNAVELRRVIAVSAVEIPKELFEEFLEANSQSTAFMNLYEDESQGTPAFGIDYFSVLRFCRWLSERDGIAEANIGLPKIEAIRPLDESQDDKSWSESLIEKDGYRLPTAIEWEIVCRSGTLSSSFLGESDQYLSRYAWNSNNTQLAPMPIATLAPNPWGFFDILGNVYEMNLGGVANQYFEVAGFERLDFGVTELTSIIVRGGSFLSNRAYCIAGARHGISPTSFDRNTGFRIVRTLHVKGNPVEAKN